MRLARVPCRGLGGEAGKGALQRAGGVRPARVPCRGLGGEASKGALQRAGG